MYEYKVLSLFVRDCENIFNQLAADGWRLVSMIPNQGMGSGAVAAFERSTAESD
ncbi:MAG: DUF4177 domain-containing protein [Lawsonibacter sp.]|nr:DUF4177 domain-containing protein [Lawsonibacter sp.]